MRNNLKQYIMKKLILFTFIFSAFLSLSTQAQKNFEGSLEYANVSKENIAKSIKIKNARVKEVKAIKDQGLSPEITKQKIKEAKKRSAQKIKAIIGPEKNRLMQGYWSKKTAVNNTKNKLAKRNKNKGKNKRKNKGKNKHKAKVSFPKFLKRLNLTEEETQKALKADATKKEKIKKITEKYNNRIKKAVGKEKVKAILPYLK